MAIERTNPSRVCITGAGSGIGAALAVRYAAMGADLLLLDPRRNAATACFNFGEFRHVACQL